MLKELDKLIIFIQRQYETLLNEWNKNSKYKKYNLKNIEVREINNNNEILEKIFAYRLFINENNIFLRQSIKKLNLNNYVDTRVKLRNSIEYKIDNYIKNHEEGKIPIIKCLNDIYGLRIVFKEDMEYNIIKTFVDSKYKGLLKCIDSTRPEEGYIATHIYFKKDNYSFPWELQIWDKKHELSNIKAHEIYKQDYTKWEKEIKGGALN